MTRNLEVKNANDIERILYAKNEIILRNKKVNLLTWLEVSIVLYSLLLSSIELNSMKQSVGEKYK